MRKNVQMVNVVRGLKAQWQTDRASDRDRRKGRRAAREKDRQQGSRCHSGFHSSLHVPSSIAWSGDASKAHFCSPRCLHAWPDLGHEIRRHAQRGDAGTRLEKGRHRADIKKKTDDPDWMGEDKARSLCPACHLPLKCSFRLKARELDNFAKWATVYWPTHPPLELRELSEEGQVEC